MKYGWRYFLMDSNTIYCPVISTNFDGSHKEVLFLLLSPLNCITTGKAECWVSGRKCKIIGQKVVAGDACSTFTLPPALHCPCHPCTQASQQPLLFLLLYTRTAHELVWRTRDWKAYGGSTTPRCLSNGTSQRAKELGDGKGEAHD